MIFKEDIHKRIESDFGNNASEVVKLIHEATTKTNYISSDRVIRCIIFLAEKNLEKLQKFIKMASVDPRDVMMCAEYINLGPDQDPKRVRDFNKTLDACETNVAE